MTNYSRNVLAIIPTPVDLKSEQYKSFWLQSNDYLKYYGTFTSSHNMTIKPNRIACYLYDAVMLYAHAATQYLAESNKTAEESLNNGAEITKRILGKTYRSKWTILYDNLYC